MTTELVCKDCAPHPAHTPGDCEARCGCHTRDRRLEQIRRTSNRVARLLKRSRKDLLSMAEHVRRHGTDHDGGALVDSITAEVLELVAREGS